MFQFGRFPSRSHGMTGLETRRVSPFGYLRLSRSYTPHRSFSQYNTSFFGTRRLGIHCAPLLAFRTFVRHLRLIWHALIGITFALIILLLNCTRQFLSGGKRGIMYPRLSTRLTHAQLATHHTTRPGDKGTRTPGLVSAIDALSQLSYIPFDPRDLHLWRHGDSNPGPPRCKRGALPTELCPPVGQARLELATSRLSGVRSNQLSYCPKSNRNFLRLTAQ